MTNLYGANGLIGNYYKQVVEAIFNKTFKFITLKGGRFSAKGDTIYTLMLLVLSNKQGEARIYVPVQRSIKTGVFKQVLKCAKRVRVVVKPNMSDYSISFQNGSKIYFNGLDANTENVNTDLSKGGDSELEHGILFCIFDEIGALKNYERIDDIIDTMIRQENCTFVEISNPPKVKRAGKRLLERYAEQEHDKRYLVIHSTAFDIPKSWLSDAQIELIKNYKANNIKRFNSAIMGLTATDEGGAFTFGEEIWTQQRNYRELYIQTDEGNRNATTFSLFGLTEDGELHYMTNYFHSARETGHVKSYSTYAKIFDEWYNKLNVDTKMVVTDGIPLKEEIRKYGYHVDDMTGKKNRVLAYELMDELVLTESFKIVDSPENISLYNEMENAEIEYNLQGQAMVSKKHESTIKHEKHVHRLDTCLYMCLRLQKYILRGRGVNE